MHAADSSQSTPISGSTPCTPGGELTEHLVEYLEHAPTSEFHGESVKVIHHWQGHDNLLWKVEAGGQQAVVKLFLDAGQARGRRQFDGQNTYAPLGIAPSPLWFDRYPQGLARQVLVYTWEDGIAPDLSENTTRRALAQTVATVHNGAIDTVRRFCPHPINLDYFWRVEAGALQRAPQHTQDAAIPALADALRHVANQADALADTARGLWQGAPPTPVHGDLLPENWLIHRRGHPLLLDWEMYGLGDPALDMARLLFHLPAPAGSDQAEDLLEAYLRLVDQPGLAERIATYGRLLPVQALAYLLNGVYTALAHPDASAGTGKHAETGDRRAVDENLPFLAQAVEVSLVAAARAHNLDAIAGSAASAVAEWQAQIRRLLAPE